jgi:periplasmic protein TonB
MLEYVAGRRAIGSRQSNPSAMLIIVSVHVALLAIVMSARMERTRLRPEPPITVETIKDPLIESKPLPPPHPQPQPMPLIAPRPDVFTPPLQPPPVSANPTLPDPGTAVGRSGVAVIPNIPQPFVTTPVHHDPRLLTPPSELKPPYPADKLLSEEEAVLMLRLTIDEHGRVIDVQPVGRTDRSFLEAARRHLMAHWRYQPATDDGRAVASSTVITLRFELDR